MSIAESNLISRAKIVFMTLAASGRQSTMESLKFLYPEVIFIDEAGQASEPETLIPLPCGAKKVVLLGDPKQLPPTVFSQTCAENGFARSLMERLMDDSSYPIHLLTEQYRMSQDLCEWSSQNFYGGLLKSSPSLAQRRPPWWNRNSHPESEEYHVEYPFGSLAAPWFRSKSIIHVDSQKVLTQIGTSWENRAEALVAAHVCKGLIDGYGVDPNEIGVITFYSAQEECLRRTLSSFGSVRVSTVDGFQGSEMPIIIISFVRAGKSSFLVSPQRLNVAVTRAQFCLIMIADTVEMKREPMLKSLLESVPRECQVKDSEVS